MKQPRNKSGQFASLPVDVRFSLKVGPEDASGCWPWTGAVTERGYGIFWLDGKMEKAQRISWQLRHGKIPEKLYALHECDNPPCVNPDHLFLGTLKDNARDMANKERGNTVKLTAADVREIRRLYEPDKVSLSILGRMFRVSPQNIWSIVRGETWRWLDQEHLRGGENS